jgi:hypothetical protein
LNNWPAFIDPNANPAKITLHDASPTSLILPSSTESPRSLPPDLSRNNIINALAFSNAFPETLREHLLVNWSEDTTMLDGTFSLNYTNKELSDNPNSGSDGKQHSHREPVSQPTESRSEFTESRSLEDVQAGKKSLSHADQASSPAAHIDELRKVLANGSSSGNNEVPSNGVPKIEINGEKTESISAESDLSLEEKEPSDIFMILDSLTVNGENGDFNEKVISTLG